jgi:predicted permease
MRTMDKVRLRLRSLFRRPQVDAELDREIHFHLQQQIEENLAAGMGAEAARRAALRTFGGSAQIKEECRDNRRLNYLETLGQDLRYGFRQLRASPGFTGVAVLTLALGIGANTTIFSITEQVLLRSLPVFRPESLVILRSPGYKTGHVSDDGDGAASFSYPLYRDLRDQSGGIVDLLARYPVSLSVAGQGQGASAGTAERLSGELVSGNYFQVLGVAPALGRTFTNDDESAPGANPVVVLSHGYWTRRYGADPSILNKTLVVNGASFTVVGVARSGFTGVQVGQSPDAFIPITMKAHITPNWDGLASPKDYWLAIIGRLKSGFTPARAEAALLPTYRALLESQAVATKVSQSNLQKFIDKPLLLEPGARGRQILQQGVKQPLTILMAMVGLVLLIGCANLASLLLARGAARQREIAVRLALGASRWRLVRQLLTESFLLALMGGAAGLVVGWWALKALVTSIPKSYGALGLDARPDQTILLFTLAVSILTGALFGLAPALRATRASLQSTLKEQGSSISEGLSNIRLRKALIVCQIAVTAILLVGAGLFARSLSSLKEVDLGLRADHLVQLSVSPQLNRYTPADTARLADRIREGISALPGVRAVSVASIGVLQNDDTSANTTVEGYTAAPDEDTNVEENYVGPDFFSTMGIPLIAGRELKDSDGADSPKVAVVNEAFAHRFFGDASPLQHRFCFGSGTVKPDIEIVGLVKDNKHSSVRSQIVPFAYMPYSQDKTLGDLTFYVRTERDPESMAAPLREAVANFDANLPVYNLKTLETQASEILFNDRLLTELSLCFALLAALLAAIGLYGVMAYTVAQRTREIGIRIALGAARSEVIWLVLREVVQMAAAGLAVGLIGALVLGRFVETVLFGVKSRDPLAFVVAAVLLAAVALLSGAAPARRAAGVDPMTALRYE